MWKDFKRMVLEAAAEIVADQAEKELVVKVWGKLVSQVIGEMKKGFFAESGHESNQSMSGEPSMSSVESLSQSMSRQSPRGRAMWNCASERIELLPL